MELWWIEGLADKAVVVSENSFCIRNMYVCAVFTYVYMDVRISVCAVETH